MITNASERDMVVALEEVNKKYDGNVIFNRYEVKRRRIFFTLKVKKARGLGGRIGFTGRHFPSACWHVCGDFFDALIKSNPTAWIRTHSHIINIDGGNWKDWNIGSIMNPLMYSDACECKTKGINMMVK